MGMWTHYYDLPDRFIEDDRVWRECMSGGQVKTDPQTGERSVDYDPQELRREGDCLISIKENRLHLCFSMEKVITVPEVHTEYVNRDRVDSLTLHDSVYIKEYVKGDTVRIVEYRYRDRFQYVYSVDTVMVADTVQVERETVVVKYDHKLRKWQKSLIGWGLFCLLCLVGYIFLRIKGFKLLS